MTSKHTSNFWRGFSSIVGLGAKSKSLASDRCGGRSDIDKIAGDFAKVGGDIETAMRKVDRDVRGPGKFPGKK